MHWGEYGQATGVWVAVEPLLPEALWAADLRCARKKSSAAHVCALGGASNSRTLPGSRCRIRPRHGKCIMAKEVSSQPPACAPSKSSKIGVEWEPKWPKWYPGLPSGTLWVPFWHTIGAKALPDGAFGEHIFDSGPQKRPSGTLELPNPNRVFRNEYLISKSPPFWLPSGTLWVPFWHTLEAKVVPKGAFWVHSLTPGPKATERDTGISKPDPRV